MYVSSTNEKDIFEKIDAINAKLSDRLFSVKKKERVKLENEMKELKSIKNYKPCMKIIIKIIKKLKKELYNVESSIWNIDYNA